MKYGRYTAHTIITTLLEEAALVAVVLWLLPTFGLNIPLWGLILMMVALGTYACVTYRLGRNALAREPILSLDVGSRGRTTTRTVASFVQFSHRCGRRGLRGWHEGDDASGKTDGKR